VYTVARLNVAPIKSTSLHHPDQIRLHRWGAEGNRVFYFARADGRLFTNKDLGPLVRLRAEYDSAQERLAIEFPDGTTLAGDATAVGAAVKTNFFGRRVHGRALEGEWSEALSAFAGRPLILVRPDQPGDANDDYAVSIFGTASAEELARQSGRSEALDSRRFRMLVEVAGTSAHQEDTWLGSAVRVGDAVVQVDVPVERCVITTQNPSTGVKDFDTLVAIKAYRGRGRLRKHIEFGVYANVIRPGTVKVGDPVEPLDSTIAVSSGSEV
jgi:MOSC domain-containing protein